MVENVLYYFGRVTLMTISSSWSEIIVVFLATAEVISSESYVICDYEGSEEVVKCLQISTIRFYTA